MRTVMTSTMFLAISMLNCVVYGQSPFKANPFSSGSSNTNSNVSGGATPTSENSNPSSATTKDETIVNKRVNNPFFSENAAREKRTELPAKPELVKQSAEGIRSLNEQFGQSDLPVVKPMEAVTSRRTDMAEARAQGTKPPANFTQMTLQQVSQHLEYGKTLARRGAAGSAKQEFLAALALLAQANDADAGSNIHSESLRRGLNALDESRDFMVSEPEKQIGRSVKEVVRGHRTDLFNDQTSEQVTTIDALRQYLFHSKQQMEFAAGKNPIAAHAFFCLGKLQTAQPSNHPNQDIVNRTQGIIYHSTALSCDTSNYQSAHELGVLLARSGELNKSKQMLERSLRIQQTPEAWKNLAFVNQNLNQTELAQQANSEYQRMLANQSGRSIHWMNASEFEQTNPVEFGDSQASKPGIQTEKSTNPDRVSKLAPSEKPSFGARIKGIF